MKGRELESLLYSQAFCVYELCMCLLRAILELSDHVSGPFYVWPLLVIVKGWARNADTCIFCECPNVGEGSLSVKQMLVRASVVPSYHNYTGQHFFPET